MNAWEVVACEVGDAIYRSQSHWYEDFAPFDIPLDKRDLSHNGHTVSRRLCEELTVLETSWSRVHSGDHSTRGTFDSETITDNVIVSDGSDGGLNPIQGLGGCPEVDQTRLPVAYIWAHLLWG